MPRAQVDEGGRAVVFWFHELEDFPEEARAELEGMFPVWFGNPETVLETVSDETRDFVIEGGAARYDPTPESREKIAAEFAQDIKQAKIDGLLEFIDSGALSLLQERG